MLRVLFVCTGNTCRSPMAEALLRAKAQTEDCNIKVLSAGVSAWDDAPASQGAMAAIREHSLDLSTHRSRPLVADYVTAADIILTMTDSHRRHVITRFPESAEKTFTLAAFAGVTKDVDDPYGGGLDEYLACADEIRHLIELAWAKIVDWAGKKCAAEKEKER